MGLENVSDINIKDLINNCSVFNAKNSLINGASDIFDFTQYLLDDDKNLTRTGNLTSSAREKLRKRIDELFLSQD